MKTEFTKGSTKQDPIILVNIILDEKRKYLDDLVSSIHVKSPLHTEYGGGELTFIDIDSEW